jgi:hypothetical protein
MKKRSCGPAALQSCGLAVFGLLTSDFGLLKYIPLPPSKGEFEELRSSVFVLFYYIYTSNYKLCVSNLSALPVK